MAYTVMKLAKISGVTVRMLHFYDEVGLLKPAYYGENGYRYYEEEQLLILQQILFYRELGFELKAIQRILGKRDFDKIAALHSHRKVLEKDLKKTRNLIKTIDNTIEHLTGKKKMKNEEIYYGFNITKEQQAKYEKQLIDYFGDKVKGAFKECEQNVKNWTKADWEKSGDHFKEICRDLAVMIDKHFRSDSKEVQSVIQQHYLFLKKFWTPNRESYIGHGQFIVDSDLRKAYEVHHPKLPTFIAEAIKVFAERELK